MSARRKQKRSEVALARLRKRLTRLIRLRLPADKGCDIATVKRELRGTGIEVDMTYEPKRVAPAIFVARGFGTKRAFRRSCGAGSGRLSFFDEMRPNDPPATLDDLWGTGAERRLQRDFQQAVREQRLVANQQIINETF